MCIHRGVFWRVLNGLLILVELLTFTVWPFFSYWQGQICNGWNTVNSNIDYFRLVLKHFKWMALLSFYELTFYLTIVSFKALSLMSLLYCRMLFLILNLVFCPLKSSEEAIFLISAQYIWILKNEINVSVRMKVIFSYSKWNSNPPKSKSSTVLSNDCLNMIFCIIDSF